MAESIFQLAEFAPHASAWKARQTELAYRRAYYDGTVYRTVRERFAALGKMAPMLGPRLYRGTKALFLMLSRAVDVDAGIVPGGWALAEDAPRAWQVGIDQVFAWSDWARDGVLYVHYGSLYGVAGLKIADLREARRVVIKPIDPRGFLLIRTSQYDPTPRMALLLEQRFDDAGETYEYAEVITRDSVRTFVAGEPAGVDGRPPDYPNALGVVPVVEARHIHTGEALGECTFEKAIPLLDEVNELASYLADIIRKHAEAQWAVIGAEPSDLVKSGDNIWYVPEGGDVKAVVAGIDVPGVLEFIREIRAQVEAGLPELAFGDLKSKDAIATATLELQLMELVLKIKRVRPNYDHGLTDALRIAGLAGQQLGLAEVAALADEQLAFDAERPVLPLDRLTAIQIEQAEVALEQQKAIAGNPEGLAQAARVASGQPIAPDEEPDPEAEDA